MASKGSRNCAISIPYITKERLFPIKRVAMISDVFLFIVLKTFPKKLFVLDFISKFSLSLEINAISKPENRPEKNKQTIINKI